MLEEKTKPGTSNSCETRCEIPITRSSGILGLVLLALSILSQLSDAVVMVKVCAEQAFAVVSLSWNPGS